MTAQRVQPMAADRATRPTPSGAIPRSKPKPPASKSSQVMAYVDVMNSLSDLDRVGRASLRLIYWQNFTQAQVATELGVPVATIRAAVARGMNQIADNLSSRRTLAE